MGDLWELLWYLAFATEYGKAVNHYLYGLPLDIQPHVLALGEWIVKLMGWS